MGKLRKTVQREVYDIINSSIFTSDDFEVTFGDPDTNEYLIVIKFNYNKTFSYYIDKQHNAYEVTQTPGDITEEEITRYKKFEDALDNIPVWCTEIRNELKAEQPIYSELDNLKQMVENHFICSGSTDNEFTVEEINDLKRKFEDLQARVSELEKDNIITESNANDIQKGLQRVKEDVEFYPKETWIKTSSNKIVNLFVTIAKSKEGRKVLTDGGRKLLGLD
jgi:septation ring formation regulator EzrA